MSTLFAVAALEPATGLYTTDMWILVVLLIANLIGTFATHWTLAARVRELRDEVLAAELGRDDLDRRTLGNPRGADEKGEHLVRTPGGDLRIVVHEGLDDEDHPIWQVCLDSSAGTITVLHTDRNEAAAVLRATREAHRRGLGDPR